MSTKEFSDQFDVLYNNITSNQAPGLNEYEKSVFLTKAQDELVKNHFVPEGNLHQKGFDESPKRQIDFSMLIKTARAEDTQTKGIVDPRAIHYFLMDDVMYIINESVQFYRNEGEEIVGVRQVLPLSYEEYTKLMSKPYKEPVKYQAWRLITSRSGDAAEVDIIITSSDKKKYLTGEEGEGMHYLIRYVKRPQPIILTDLAGSFGENITIHRKSEESDCELDPSVHEEILQRAVELAKVAWQGDVQTAIEAGKRSE